MSIEDETDINLFGFVMTTCPSCGAWGKCIQTIEDGAVVLVHLEAGCGYEWNEDDA